MSSASAALLLVRFLGLVALLFGVLWLVNLVCAVAISLGRAPDWITSAVWEYTAQGLLAGPIWFLAGFVLLNWSSSFAAFVAKGTENHVR